VKGLRAESGGGKWEVKVKVEGERVEEADPLTSDLESEGESGEGK
jgi:hypothetical protein